MRKRMRIRSVIVLMVIFNLVVALPISGFGEVPQQISCQGFLTDDSGNPVSDDDFVMVFSIYESAAGGTALWWEEQTVKVANGIYNVQIGQDPVGNPFPTDLFDDQRWLGVSVGTDAEMTPRQPLTSVPYALQAGGTSIGAVTSVMLADEAVTETKVANGAITAEKIVGGSGSGVDADLLDGHTSGDFVLSGQDYGRFNVTGNLYEGTTTLTGKYVNETGDTMSGQLTINTPGTGLYSLANTTASSVFGVRVDANQSSTNNYYTYGLYSDTDSEAETSLTYGTYSNAYGTYATYGVWGYGRSRDSNAYGVYGYAYGDAGASSIYGVRSYAEQATGNNSSVYGNYNNAYARGTGSLWGGRNYAYHYGTAGGNTYGLHALSYGSDEGTAYGVYATAANAASNYAGYFTTTVDAGIPVVGLQSSAYTTSDLSYWAPGGFFGGRNGAIGFTEEEFGYGLVGEATADSTRGVYGVAYGSSVYGGYFYGSGTSAVGIYAYGTLYAADFNGNVRIRSGSTTVMELGDGLDYAEGFDVSDMQKPDPGSVLIIDPENPGKLTVSTTAYDTKVAGIVAGANDLGSGVRLGGDQFDNDVALAGRVYCNVDASHAAINTGDLLTTSEVPGYAMKAGDHVRAQGAILGKAMQDMAMGEKGQILVLVTLQ